MRRIIAEVDRIMFRANQRARTFRDRQDAGRELAEALLEERLEGELIVLGLPRGGVPVAYEVAAALDAPMDVLVVRKLGAPFNPELAVGGIALGGIAVYNEELLDQLGLDADDLAPIRERERAELARRDEAYRGQRPPPDCADKTVILVDDGIATGATMYAAVKAVKELKPRQVVVAVPTSSVDALRRLEREADQVIAISTPEPYVAVGAWYRHFGQLSDHDVVELLGHSPPPAASGG